MSDRKKLDEALVGAPKEMTLMPTGEPAWAKWKTNNTDPYGERIVEYSSDWARLMEKQMAVGASVADCADKTSRLADYDGITGFMYGAAVAVLASCWLYGDSLKAWHNEQYGKPEAKGVINPAVMVMSSGGK